MIRSIVVQGHRWNFERLGDGPPILWLHGFTGSHESWQRVSASFSTNHTCIAPDIIGHGGSDAPSAIHPYRMSAVVDSIRSLMLEQGFQLFDVVGYSMGGRVALSLAAQHPSCVQKLVLESASPGIEEEHVREMRRQDDEALAAWIEDHGLVAFVNRWEQIPLFKTQAHLPPEVLMNQRRIRLSHDIRGLCGSLRGTGTGVQPSLWPCLEKLPHRTLLLTGQQDDKFTVLNRIMAQRMPYATHTIVQASGHTVHLEQPDLYVSAVRSFLDSD